MVKLYEVLDRYGRFGRVTGTLPYTDLAVAWRHASTRDGLDPSLAPHTVVELVPVPRPVPPRPVGKQGSPVVGCYYRGRTLYRADGIAQVLTHADGITAAADLWQRHQEWIAAGGKDDE